jgi:3-methyladenine DNA glycosylase Mpg
MMGGDLPFLTVTASLSFSQNPNLTNRKSALALALALATNHIPFFSRLNFFLNKIKNLNKILLKERIAISQNTKKKKKKKNTEQNVPVKVPEPFQ